MATTSISTPTELVAAREARGLTASDMQRQLKLHMSQLEALERGEWDALPGLSFVRGILRAYGRVLEADVEPLLAAIGGHAAAMDLRASSLAEPIRRSGMLGFDNGGSGSSWTWIVLSIVALAAVAMFFGRGGESGAPAQPAGSAAQTPATGGDSRAGTSSTASSQDSDARSDAAPGPSAQGAAIASYSAELEVKRVGGAEQLQVRITPAFSANAGGSPVVVIMPVPVKVSMLADSWVEAQQVDGRTLLRGDRRSGEVSELSAVGTLTLTSPYPPRYRLEYDGRSVPLELPAGSETAKVQFK